MHRKATIAIAAFIATSVGAFVWHRLTRPSLENDEIAFYIAEAQPLYRSLPRINLGEGTAEPDLVRDKVLESLRSAEVVGVGPSSSGALEIQFPSSIPPSSLPAIRSITPEMHESLVNEAADLVVERFVNRDPSRYITYRAGRGATLARERYDKHFPGTFEAVAARLLGPGLVSGATPRTLLEASFANHVPSEIAAGNGVAIAYGVDSPMLAYADLAEATLGYTGWSGGLSLGFAPMTSLPYTRSELLAELGPLPSAYVGFVTFYTDRSPRPMAFWFNWNAVENRWILMRVMLMNFSNEEAMASMYPEF
jgi:hypothetical protein